MTSKEQIMSGEKLASKETIVITRKMSGKETFVYNSKLVAKAIRNHLLVVCTIASVLLGIIVGSILRQTTETPWTEQNILYVNFIGELFLRILKSLILPLIATSLLTGISSLNLKLSRKIGGRAIAFYLTTTFLAVVLGIFLATTIRPGHGTKVDFDEKPKTKGKNITTVDTLLDLMRNLCPPNIVQACIEQSTTDLLPPENCTESVPFNNSTARPLTINCTTSRNSTGPVSIYDYEIKNYFVEGTNIMGIVTVSTVMGIAMSVLQAELTHFTAVINELYVLVMKLTSWATMLSPIGIFFLVVSQIIKMDDMGSVAEKLGYYFLTVVLGCFLQGFVILPTIYFVFTRKNPFLYIHGLSQALVNAFGTSSSSATMPITLRCVIENNNVDANVAKFMLPIGSAINMDGTALYEAVAAIFISQLREVDLSFGKIIAVSITATAASIGAAGIPSAGFVTMIMVLETVGLPAGDVTLILAVDWLLDRIRTVINVMGDAFGAGIINHISKNDILEFNNRKTSSNIALHEHLEIYSQKNHSSISLTGRSNININSGNFIENSKK